MIYVLGARARSKQRLVFVKLIYFLPCSQKMEIQFTLYQDIGHSMTNIYGNSATKI